MSAGMPKLRARSRFQVPLKFGLVVVANTSIDTAMIAANASNSFFAIAVLLLSSSFCSNVDQREQRSSHKGCDQRHQHHHCKDASRENTKIVANIQHDQFD